MRRRKFIAIAAAVGAGSIAGCGANITTESDSSSMEMSQPPNTDVFQSIKFNNGSLIVRVEEPPLITYSRIRMFADEINIINETTGRVEAEDDIDLSATEYTFSIPEGTYRVSLEADKTDAHHSHGGYAHLYAQVTVEGGEATVDGYEFEGYVK